MSTFHRCLSRISTAVHRVAHLQGARKGGLERLSWLVTCLNHAGFRLFTDARRGPCGPTWTFVLLCTQSLVSLVLQVGDAEKLPRTLGLDSLDPFLRVSKQGPCLTAAEENRDVKGLVELELILKLMVLLCQILFTTTIAGAILIQISSEKV